MRRAHPPLFLFCPVPHRHSALDLNLTGVVSLFHFNEYWNPPPIHASKFLQIRRIIRQWEVFFQFSTVELERVGRRTPTPNAAVLFYARFGRCALALFFLTTFATVAKSLNRMHFRDGGQPRSSRVNDSTPGSPPLFGSLLSLELDNSNKRVACDAAEWAMLPRAVPDVDVVRTLRFLRDGSSLTGRAYVECHDFPECRGWGAFHPVVRAQFSESDAAKKGVCIPNAPNHGAQMLLAQLPYLSAGSSLLLFVFAVRHAAPRRASRKVNPVFLSISALPRAFQYAIPPSLFPLSLSDTAFECTCTRASRAAGGCAK
ncbi:hypothetical protein C8R45DRAFT_1224201 [Mycena sanguinolenta]|nr:hypothetical protein C8R45DRAFT_1224201 [Mycena sanguinolenta]